ncbi:hypothetical protein EXS71_03905 [Candidatus Uhrbacteria bacterium]|nr:hypothetical protein [Candidatus Uhrbacteria bacterium]
MNHQPLSVAVPWSLSHYIPLNGFHPLYRSLFDQAPPSVELHAWDNVKLHNRFGRDIEIRDIVLRAANEENSKLKKLGDQSIEKAYQEYFWPPNHALMDGLAGDIEFHHTAPYPSLKRPFVFHCESFTSIFLPFAQQGSGEFKNHEKLRDHYRQIFENPLCLGIFSHIPETLESISRFFASTDIDRKLFSSKIGLSLKAIADQDIPEKYSLSRPTFLFVNSANQNPANFFRRGGHIVLRFWKEFIITNGRDGLLMLRCTKPSDEDLRDYGVDASFMKDETGRSIIWAEDYLANHEINALMASAHFFLLPSSSLHSVSIMQAMTLGTIPVVTDTVGTAVYLEDEQHGIVLRGVRAAIWYIDENTGILVDRYGKTPSLDDSLVAQMTNRIFSLLDTNDAYQQMRSRAMAHARQRFSGDAFSQDFWNAVLVLYKSHKESTSTHDPLPNKTAHSLQDCILQGDGWARVFEGVTQPRKKIYTGQSQSTVWELGGAVIHAHGNPVMELSDWSVFARYFNPEAPETTFANTLGELGGKYLSLREDIRGDAKRWARYRQYLAHRLIGFISRALMPYPELHSFVARMLKRLRNKSNSEPEFELVLQGVSGYNVLRYFHKFYAIPQSEGAFVPDKARSGGYSSSYSGNTADKVLRKIGNAAKEAIQAAPNKDDSMSPHLVIDGFLGFNIIRFGGEFYAILKNEGAFEYDKILSKGYSKSFSGYSISEVQEAISMNVSTQEAVAFELKSKEKQAGV